MYSIAKIESSVTLTLAQELRSFAAADQFIPEPGDDVEAYNFDNCTEDEEAHIRENWEDFCNRADAATQEAQEQIEVFQRR